MWNSLNHLLRVHDCVSAAEDVGQHVFGDLGASDSQGVAGVLHFAQALSQSVQLLGHFVRARVADVGEAVVDLPEELAELKGSVDVAVAHAADAQTHELPREVGHAQQVIRGGHVEGQDERSHRRGVSGGLRICFLCPHEHKSGVDFLEADEGAMADEVLEGNSLHILLDTRSESSVELVDVLSSKLVSDEANLLPYCVQFSVSFIENFFSIRDTGDSVQKEDGPFALNGDVSTNLDKSLILVMFGVKLLLKNFKSSNDGRGLVCTGISDYISLFTGAPFTFSFIHA